MINSQVNLQRIELSYIDYYVPIISIFLAFVNIEIKSVTALPLILLAHSTYQSISKWGVIFDTIGLICACFILSVWVIQLLHIVVICKGNFKLLENQAQINVCVYLLSILLLAIGIAIHYKQLITNDNKIYNQDFINSEHVFLEPQYTVNLDKSATPSSNAALSFHTN